MECHCVVIRNIWPYERLSCDMKGYDNEDMMYILVAHIPHNVNTSQQIHFECQLMFCENIPLVMEDCPKTEWCISR